MYDDVEAGFEFDSGATPDIYTELTVVLVSRETWRVRDKLNFENESRENARFGRVVVVVMIVIVKE